MPMLGCSRKNLRTHRKYLPNQHPQSDADFLSKASIALKEARESENWLSLLRDNGYLSATQAESILSD